MLCDYLNFYITTGSGVLNSPESENHHFQFFGKNQNQGIANLSYFKSL